MSIGEQKNTVAPIIMHKQNLYHCDDTFCQWTWTEFELSPTAKGSGFMADSIINKKADDFFETNATYPQKMMCI